MQNEKLCARTRKKRRSYNFLHGNNNIKHENIMDLLVLKGKKGNQQQK